jgi:shikimate kinase
MMGAGKTSVGRICAERLGRPFVDTDAEVEQTAGKSVGQIFEDEGEPAFRKLEHEELIRICSSDQPAVISCGGGVVQDRANRTALKMAGFVVWLQASSSVLGDRVRPQGVVRPLISPRSGATPVETLDRIASEREPMYLDVADATIDTNALTIDQVADRVVRAFERASA